VPIVLAGAFLGVSGAAVAVLLAVGMRLSLGGVGTFAGVASICTAGAIGMAWAIATGGPAHRAKRVLVGLGLGASVAHFSAMLLPADAAWSFFTQTAPLLSVVYLAMIPPLAKLLEQQRIAMQREAWLREAGFSPPANSFDSPESLTLVLAAAKAAGRFRHGADMLALRVRARRLALSFWGDDVEVTVLRDLGVRLRRMLPDGAEMGMVEHGRFLIFLERTSEDVARDRLARICREAGRKPFPVPGMAAVRLRLDGRHVAFDEVPRWGDVVRAFDAAGTRSDAPPPAIPRETVARLFDVTDRLFEARSVESGRGYRRSRS
jgi:hypothetical protein